MTLCCLTNIDLCQKIHYAIWCLLGYICSCFLHTLDRLVRRYTLSRFCTLLRKSQRFIAHKQKLVYSISRRQVLLVEEIEVPGENHRPVTSYWQALSHIVVSSTHRLGVGVIQTVSGQIGTWSFRHLALVISAPGNHTCDRVAMLQLEICKVLAGDLVS
jgi:hypothetical protein